MKISNDKEVTARCRGNRGSRFHSKLLRKPDRIEIPASITAVEFYKKQGYDYKNGLNQLDDEGHYRLEKFNKR